MKSNGDIQNLLTYDLVIQDESVYVCMYLP